MGPGHPGARWQTRGELTLNQLHLLVALTYTVIAGGVAFAAPIGMSDVSVMQAAVLGGLFWVAALVMHEIFVRLRGQTHLWAEIASQRVRRGIQIGYHTLAPVLRPGSRAGAQCH